MSAAVLAATARPIQAGSRKEQKARQAHEWAILGVARIVAGQGRDGLKKVIAQATEARAQCRWAHASRLYAIAAAAVPANPHRPDGQQIGLARFATICSSMAAPGPGKRDRQRQIEAARTHEARAAGVSPLPPVSVLSLVPVSLHLVVEGSVKDVRKQAEESNACNAEDPQEEFGVVAHGTEGITTHPANPRPTSIHAAGLNAMSSAGEQRT